MDPGGLWHPSFPVPGSGATADFEQNGIEIGIEQWRTSGSDWSCTFASAKSIGEVLEHTSASTNVKIYRITFYSQTIKNNQKYIV